MEDRVPLVPAHVSVAHAAREIAKLDTEVLFILREGKLAGMVSESDIVRKIIAAGLDPESILISDLMQTEVTCIKSGAPLKEACAMIGQEKIRYLPVVNSELEPEGLVNALDLLFFFESSAEFGEILGG